MASTAACWGHTISLIFMRQCHIGKLPLKKNSLLPGTDAFLHHEYRTFVYYSPPVSKKKNVAGEQDE